MFDYDFVVLGSGPAGEKAATLAADSGKKVAIVETRAQPGGVCVHTGTIPSKTLRESSLYLSGIRSRGLYGVNYLVKHDISVQDFMYRRHQVVQREIDLIYQRCARSRIDLLPGWGEFIDPHTIVVKRPGGEEIVTSEHFLISTGSRPWHPDFLPFDDPSVYDSDTVLDMKDIPRSMTIIGSGVIGCEYSTIFAALGIRVVLMDERAQLLPFLDREIASKLHEGMMKLGIQLLQGEAVEKVKRVNDHELVIFLKSGQTFNTESLLFAAGRQGNTQNIGLDKLGLKPNKRGQLLVNEHYQTEIPTIYAAGDVIGFPSLASTSMEQGRTAVSHAFGLGEKDGVTSLLPFGIYTIPEVSAVGESEESCREKGIPYEVGKAGFGENTRGQIIGDLDGMTKLVFRPDDRKLLGVHVIGDRASELIHIGQTALHFGATIDYFVEAVFNYPTLAESYKAAAYDGLAKLKRLH